ncbi:MAG: hypothetical protein ACT4O3_01865 [Elusimicrobiota bacterium]
MRKILLFPLLAMFLCTSCHVHTHKIPPGQIKKQTAPGQIKKKTGYNPASGKFKNKK